MSQRHIAIPVSLDAKGAFDAAWWPKLLKQIKRIQLPENLNNLGKSYLSERTAILTTRSMQTERKFTKGCPHVSCCGPGFWNNQNNSMLNLEFGKRTKAIAYADDLLIAVQAETVTESRKLSKLTDK